MHLTSFGLHWFVLGMQSALGSAVLPLIEWDLTDHPRETQRLGWSTALLPTVWLCSLDFGFFICKRV